MNGIGNYFSNNSIGNGFSSNSIGNDFKSNSIGNDFGSNSIGNDFNSNSIGNGFNGNTIADYFQLNNVKAPVSSIDFTSNPATYVYVKYNCDIFSRSDFALRLSYYDNLDVLNIDDIDN